MSKDEELKRLLKLIEEQKEVSQASHIRWAQLANTKGEFLRLCLKLGIKTAESEPVYIEMVAEKLKEHRQDFQRLVELTDEYEALKSN